MLPYYSEEYEDRLFEDRERNVLFIAMFDINKIFSAFAYTNLNYREIVLKNMPFCLTSKNGKKYAKNSSNISIQTIIIGGKAPLGQRIDHINSDGLDNRIENLRYTSYGVNSHNKVKKEGTSCEFSGVHAWGQNWRSYICFERTLYYLGQYDTAEKAAKIRDVYAVHFYKNCARLNIKDGKYFLTKEEIENICKNGIPDKYKIIREERELPECIYQRGSKWYYSKQYDCKIYTETYDTKREAEEGLIILSKYIAHKEGKRKEKIEANIVRNLNGNAILYTHDKNGNINGEIKVDDNIWKKFIHNCWSRSRDPDGKNRGASGNINGKTAGIHIHIWTTLVGPIPEKLSIDHINRDPLDNRLENLRLADRYLQAHNVNSSKKSCFRYKGLRVCMGVFQVIFKDRVYGYYYYEEDAIREYNRAVTEEFEEDAYLLPEPAKTRTTVADYFSNLSIEFIESLDTVIELQELFYFKPQWGKKYKEINKDNYEICRDLAIKLRTEEIKNNFVDRPFENFTIEYIQSIKTVKAMKGLFKARPDWKRRHFLHPSKINKSNIEEYKTFALQSKREQIENWPVNDNFKPIVSKINRDNKIVLNIAEDLKDVKLPTITPLTMIPSSISFKIEKPLPMPILCAVKPGLISSVVNPVERIAEKPIVKSPILKVITYVKEIPPNVKNLD